MSARVRLVLILAFAASIRLFLTLRGGQYFDWDEYRYGFSTLMLARLRDHDVGGALNILFRYPEHPGFKIIGVIVAMCHSLAARGARFPISDMRYASNEWVPAFLFSLSAVCSAGLVYLIALRSRASRDESVFAALLMSASTTIAMYSQHLFPYDVSMAIFLWAIYIAMGDRPGVATCVASGVLAGVAFSTYEGYWLLVLTVVATLLAWQPPRPRAMLQRMLLFGAGFSSVLAALIAASASRGLPLLRATFRFAQSVTHGEFSEGWRLPWRYFWHAEHAFLLLVLAGAAAALVYRTRRGLFWLSISAMLYGGLVAGSTLFHQFVVYDRLGRQLWPFLCLAAAAGYGAARPAWITARRGALIYAGITALFLFNARPLLMQRYPREIVADVVAQYGTKDLQLDTNLMNTVDSTSAMFLPLESTASVAPSLPPKRYVLLNARDLWFEGATGVKDVPSGRVIARWPHPRQWRALQYHGYTADQRDFIRSTDISVRLIDTGQQP